MYLGQCPMNTETTLLIIDDERAVRQSLAAYFEDLDYHIQTVETAEEGLALLLDHHYDLAIVDMRLPGKDGNTFISEAHQIQPGLKFIIHTGSKQYLLPDALKHMGLTQKHVLLKPVRDMMRFTKLINAILHEGEVS